MRIGHVHLRASNLDPIRKFYVDLLGFQIVKELPGALFISDDGYHHHLAFNTWQSKGAPTDKSPTGLYHVAINFDTREELAYTIKRLVENNYPLQGASDHGTHEAVYLQDPEGNGLELAWDRPENMWPRDVAGEIEFELRPLNLNNLLDAVGDQLNDNAPAKL